MNNEQLHQQQITPQVAEQPGYQITGEAAPVQLSPDVSQVGVEEINTGIKNQDPHTVGYITPAGSEFPVVDAKTISLEKVETSKKDDKDLNRLFGRRGRIVSFFRGLLIEPFGRGSHNANEWIRLENAHDEKERQKIMKEQTKVTTTESDNTNINNQPVIPQPVPEQPVEPTQNNITQFPTQNTQTEEVAHAA
jgi:hypothetical protein